MAATHHPSQKLCCVPRTVKRPSLLLAAAGAVILTYDLETRKLLNYGPPFDEAASEEGDSIDRPNPAKRRKLNHSTLSQETSEDSVEIVAERKKGERRKPKVEESKLPNVSHLVATSNGQNIVAVTTEDKCIIVFSLTSICRLIVESQRSMPKRLCSITLTPDEETIIAADKFGDVYSLPLHPSDDYAFSKTARDAPNGTFQPSATQLTVHTKGNLEALRQQQEQKKRNPRKEGPDFEHKLLLGHVSLLTDVLVASAEISGQQRRFILTADRDEHVRISRYPQTHIVHGYCLGFGDFVSKICTVPWSQNFLIVGSGEPSLEVFDWQRGTLVSQVTFDGHVQDVLKSIVPDDNDERSFSKLAVSGIWPVAVSTSLRGTSLSGDSGGFFLVALEGLPCLLSFYFTQEGRLQYRQNIPLGGNVLDVTVNMEKHITAIVSIDNVHVPGSMLKQRTETSQSDAIITFELDSTSLQWSRSATGFTLTSGDVQELQEVPSENSTQAARSSRARGEYSTLGEFLYGLENLRKKRELYTEDLEGSVEGTEETVQQET